MEKHFMLDIETTGIDPAKEDLLQIGVLEVDFVDGFWRPGRSLEITQHTGRMPVSSFAKEHMTALYDRCNAAEWVSPERIRHDLRWFFQQECAAEPPNVYLMGWNASNFDVPFLVHNRCLTPTSYQPGPDGKDVLVGDFHYRIYELGGAVSLVGDVLGYTDRSKLCKDAEMAGSDSVQLPAGKEHDALWDCYNQLRMLNGLIRMTRK